MTFAEAAAEVLRLVGKPLHYKDITDIAVQKNLLSHVGKSPEVTMGARLASQLKKSAKENPLVRVKPGFFALRSWEESGPPGFAADNDLPPPYGPPKEAPAKAKEAPREAREGRAETPREPRGPKPQAGEGRGRRSQRPGAPVPLAAVAAGISALGEDETHPAQGALPLDEHEARAHEPRAHEPRTHEPRSHEPRTHEPRSHEPRTHEPRSHEPRSHEGPGRGPGSDRHLAEPKAPTSALFEPAESAPDTTPEPLAAEPPRAADAGGRYGMDEVSHSGEVLTSAPALSAGPSAPAEAHESTPRDALFETSEEEETARLPLVESTPSARPSEAETPAPVAAAPAAEAPRPPRDDRRGRDGRDGRGDRGDRGPRDPQGNRPPFAQGNRRPDNRPETRPEGRPENKPIDPLAIRRAAGEEEERSAPLPDEIMRADLAAGAGEIFGEEDDDNQPILGGDVQGEASGRRRRRRRRGGRNEAGPRENESGLPSYTVSPAFGDAPAGEPAEARSEARPEARPEARREERPESRRDAPREPRESREVREPREAREPRETREAREAREGREAREAREAREVREPREEGGEARREERPASAEGEGDEIAGRDLVDVLLNALGGFDRSGGPVPMRTVAEAAQRRGKVQGDPAQVVSQMAAAARADNLKRSTAGQRPRFRLTAGRIALTDWSLNQELLRLEGEALAAVERYRDASRRSLSRKLGELPAPAFVELCLTLLDRLGCGQLRTVKRPGGSNAAAETHLTGLLKGPAGETRVAVVIRRDGREIGRERVIEARGSLHHYAGATAAWLITGGQVLSGAREEAQALAGAAPVALLDGPALARLCEEHGLAVIKASLPIALPDLDFFDALRGV